MSLTETSRPVAALVLAIGLFVALPGCGGKPPADNKGDKKDQNPNSGSTPNTNTGTNPDAKGGDTNPIPTKPPEKVELNSGVGKEAVDFLTALREGKAKADQLSQGFVKRLGVPIGVFDDDKKKGYSASEAETRLKRLGNGLSFGLPAGFAGNNAAVLWGGFMSPDRNGGYNLRMVNEGGAWKVDYLSLTSANFTATEAGPGGPESEYQRFAARAVAGAICDKNGMPRDEQAAVIAAGLTPALRAQRAKPRESDTKDGLDYNSGELQLKAAEFGGGAESYSVTQQGAEPVFKVEVTKGGGAKSSFTMKLTRGTTPGQWLAESVTAP
jgi:hypothetical protein